MNRMNRSERIALGAMVAAVVSSLVAAAQGYIVLGFLLFLAAAIPLPMLAAIPARRAPDVDLTPHEEIVADSYGVPPVPARAPRR